MFILKRVYVVTAENGDHAARIGENPFSEGWQNFISLLPPHFQEQARQLPQECRDRVYLLATNCRHLVDEFPLSPLTPLDLAPVTEEFKGRAAEVARALAHWGGHPFNELWNKKRTALRSEIARLGRDELAAALLESISQDSKDRFNPLSSLGDYCFKAVRSFVGINLGSTLVGGRLRLENDFSDLPLLPLYCLGAHFINIGNRGTVEVLDINFPYRNNGGETGEFYFSAVLKEPAPFAIK